jgi:hypothetical protein
MHSSLCISLRERSYVAEGKHRFVRRSTGIRPLAQAELSRLINSHVSAKDFTSPRDYHSASLAVLFVLYG